MAIQLVDNIPDTALRNRINRLIKRIYDPNETRLKEELFEELIFTLPLSDEDAIRMLRPNLDYLLVLNGINVISPKHHPNLPAYNLNNLYNQKSDSLLIEYLKKIRTNFPNQ